jgi:hypothetical protein
MGNKQSGNKQFSSNNKQEQEPFVLNVRNKEILPKPDNNINNNTQNLEQQEFVLTVTDHQINEVKEFFGKPDDSLIEVNNLYKEKFSELKKNISPLVNETPTNFIVKIYIKARDTILYNKTKISEQREANLDVFDSSVKNAAEITNEHVTITLGIISTTALAIAPPIGLLIAASSILILKTLHTIRSNHELFDIMNDLLNLLTVLTEEFKITNDNNAPHIVILKNHIIKIFSLMSSINGIYNWRKMVIFPNAVINAFVKEISLINTALIVDLKIDLTSLTKDKNNEKDKVTNINDRLVGGEVSFENVKTQLLKEESEKGNEILNTVMKEGVNIDNSELNKDIQNLVSTTNNAAQDPQLRAEYIKYLKQELNQNNRGGSKLKKNVQHKFRRTKNLKKHKNKTSKSKNIKKKKKLTTHVIRL